MDFGPTSINVSQLSLNKCQGSPCSVKHYCTGKCHCFFQGHLVAVRELDLAAHRSSAEEQSEGAQSTQRVSKSSKKTEVEW